MVLTNTQTMTFFTGTNQMAIPAATVTQLAQEGVGVVGDLEEFSESNLKQIAENLKRPGGRVPDPAAGASQGATIPTPPFIFGVKSLMRLTVASKIV